MRKNSIKNTRVNAEVQRELSNILRGGIKDPRVAPLTSVVAVEVAPDLKTCKAYISVLGDKKAQEDTIKGLQSAEGYIRRELARTVNMRNTFTYGGEAACQIELFVGYNKIILALNLKI